MSVKLSDYRPFLRVPIPAPFSTQVQADDNANPTNWVSVMVATMPAGQVVAGEYELMGNFIWTVDSAIRSAYFRFLVNGIVIENTLRVESGDPNDVNSEFVRGFINSPAGVPITVEIQAVLENIGGTDTLIIDAGDMDITVQCKANA